MPIGKMSVIKILPHFLSVSARTHCPDGQTGTLNASSSECYPVHELLSLTQLFFGLFICLFVLLLLITEEGEAQINSVQFVTIHFFIFFQ